MRYYYDLHIHTALSPCAEDDMTPNNIARMAGLKGLDIIAVTDHNTALNAPAVMAAAARLGGPLVIPGMELETEEEVHILLLFETAEGALACGEEVAKKLLPVENRPDIYGRQLVLDREDNVIAAHKQLLTVSAGIGVYEAAALAGRHGGIAIPAHIYRPAHGIIATLLDVPPDMGFSAVETTFPNDGARMAAWEERGYGALHDSDAHALALIAERGADNWFELEALSVGHVLAHLKRFVPNK
ncbi:MAG: PHP domain-containing protein [Clostridiales bacterium]|jgi:predicted metal-dependent phosphoesterase TrpH|nr:PHP domain-containing protein [Clostridiales bacterium]